MSIVTLTFDLWPPKSIGCILSSRLTCLPSLIKKSTTVKSLLCSQAYFHRCPVWPWPLTSKINRVHPLITVNMSAKFDKEICNGLVSMVFTSLFPYMSIMTLTFDLWPPKSIGCILSSRLTCLPSLIKKSTTVKSLLCSQAYFHRCPVWPWPLTSKINRVHPLITVNMSAKFDKEICNGLVSMVFTSLFPYMSIMTLTFDLQNQ